MTQPLTDPAVGRAVRLRRLAARAATAVGPESRPTPLSVVLMAQWLGLVTGLLELVLLLVQDHFFGTATIGGLQLNRHFPWMIPVTHLMIFSVAGLVLAPMALLRARFVPRLTAFLLCALSFFSLIATIPGLYLASSVILACGLSAPFVRLLAGEGFRRRARRRLPVLFGCVLLLGGIRSGQVHLVERWAHANLPPARTNAPNVLLIVMDTVRADHLSLHGYGRDTSPNLVRFASRAVRFEQARATAPWTLPSHASMFTGRWQSEIKVFVNRPLDATFPTLAEFLGGCGYVTGGFVANTGFCNSWYGLARGFIHYEDYYANDLVVSLAETFRSAELGRRVLRVINTANNVRSGETNQRKDAARINGDFLAWLGKQENRPFFAFLNYYDAHDPYVAPEWFHRNLGLKPTTVADYRLLQGVHVNQRLADGKGVTPRDIALVNDAYDDCVASIDEQLGRLFDELDRRGVLSNTLVIVTADHGEHLGEHKIYGHGQSLYRPELHVPLLIAFPAGAPSGVSISAPVSLRDLAATVVDRVGLGKNSPFPGRTLARFWDQAPEPSDPRAQPVLSELIRGAKRDPHIKWPPALRGRMQSLVADGNTYIRNGDGSEELYDLEADPAEVHDLSGAVDAPATLERFRAAAKQIRREEARRR